MINLVISIIAIAFFTLVMMAGTGYIDFSSVLRLTESINIHKKIAKIESIISGYQIKFGTFPADNSVLVKYIKNDFRSKGQALSEVSIFGENLFFDSSFNMLSNANGYPVEICFGSNTVTENHYESIVQVSKKLTRENYNSDKMTISHACGEILDKSFSDFPEKIWVTYRIN